MQKNNTKGNQRQEIWDNTSITEYTCYGTVLNGVERPVITCGAGIEIVFIVLGRRILDKNQGFPRRGNEP